MAPGKYFGTNGVRFRPGIDYGMDFVIDFAEAIGTHLAASPILVGYDTRKSSPGIAKAAASGLMSVGLDVGEAELAPTPALQVAVKALGYKGAVIVTASHNPAQYNGIKVAGYDGVELSRADEEQIERIYEDRSQSRKDWSGVGEAFAEARVLREYIARITSLVNAREIRRRKFRVVVDPGNGSQCVAAPYLLEQLGCNVHTINAHADGNFPGRGAEPSPDSLGDLSKAVVSLGADLGVAYDGDGDRAIFCDETGRIHWGDRSGALIAGHALKKHGGGLLVTTVSSSQLLDDIVRSSGGKIFRTRVGSVEVSRAMIEMGALLGLEENGGCMYAPHIPVRDGGITTALMLEALQKGCQTLSSMLASQPTYHQWKGKFECAARRDMVMDSIRSRVRGRVETLDGVKVWVDEQTWVLIRPSGTEPLIRVFAESDREDKLADIVRTFTGILTEALSQQAN